MIQTLTCTNSITCNKNKNNLKNLSKSNFIKTAFCSEQFRKSDISAIKLLSLLIWNLKVDGVYREASASRAQEELSIQQGQRATAFTKTSDPK